MGGIKSKAGDWLKSLITPDGLKGVGSVLESLSGNRAANRGTQLDAMMEADQMGILAARDRRDDEAHLWKMLQAANYIKSGGKERKPQFSSSGAEIPTFGIGPAPITQADKDMASTLEQQLTQRLNNPPKLRDYDSKMEPGKMENILGWLGAGASGVGAVRSAGQPAGVGNSGGYTTMPRPPAPPIPPLPPVKPLNVLPGRHYGDPE